MSYITTRVDTSMGLDKTTGCAIPIQVWNGLDLLAKKKNKNKAELLRPLIADYVARELKRHKLAQPQ